MVTLEHPELVRRVILAGTGPAGGGGIEKINRIAASAYTKAALTLRDPRHFLFFNRERRTGKRAATEYMARLKERTEDRDKRISLQARRAQLKAIRAAGLQAAPRPRQDHASRSSWPTATTTSWSPAATRPTWPRRIPNAKLTIYPDSGHGGVFQYHREFVPAVLEFLEG